MNVIPGNTAGNWLAAATVSLVGHAAAAAIIIDLENTLPPEDPPLITVELVLLDEPAPSAKTSAGPPPPDVVPDISPEPALSRRSVPPDTTPSPSAGIPRDDRSAGSVDRLPRVKPPIPRIEPAVLTEPSPSRARPESDITAIVDDVSPPVGPDVDILRSTEVVSDGGVGRMLDQVDMSTTPVPSNKWPDTGQGQPLVVSHFLTDELWQETSVGASLQVADVRRPGKIPTGITRGVRVAAENRPPGYPLAARRLGLEGRVLLRVDVDRTGVVKRVAITKSSGHRLLDEAARRAMDKWRFLPAMVNGEAASGAVDVPVSFRLN